ncbi:hypothetical protein J2777_001883 [Paraburkholderia graminis]|jgi:hypothetical protein|nr:hypothetical protein [Paraburkholderia graminis]
MAARSASGTRLAAVDRRGVLEGAARVSRDGAELGRAYLELTGYAGALRMGGP